MSQTTRSKVAALERHRGAVARELATVCEVYERDGSPGFDLDMVGILSGKHFDVHAAREHAKTLVALADEQAVFEDWTRDKGLGPENREPGAFGGWCPGSVIRERAGGGPREMQPCWETPGCTHEHAAPGGWPCKLAREWASLGNDRRAPMGRSLARLGQRILDMLEGQASECQGCSGRGWLSERPMGQGERITHEPCHGTGHNLRGKLPGVEWSPAVRRKVLDAYNERLRRHVARPHVPWTLLMVERYGADVSPDDGRATRVCPRGEHRSDWEPLTYPRYGGTVMRCQVDADGYIDEPRAWALLPAWRRGEIEHARQRWERARRRRWQLAEAPSVETTAGSDRFANVTRARFRVLGVAAFEYFRACMDDRSPVDLTRISSGLPDGEWVVDGLSTEADTAGGLTWTEVSITRLIRVEMPGRIESVRVEGTIFTE